MSRWQGRWLVWVWMLSPGVIWGQEPLLIPRAGDASHIRTAEGPLKLGRSNTARGSTTNTSKTSSAWGTTTGSLIFVVGVIVLAGFIYSRNTSKLAGMLPDNVLQVLGKRYLDSRTSLQLIRCGSKILVVSNSAQHGLTTLTEITDPQEVEQITGQCLPEKATRAPVNASLSGPHIGKSARTPTGQTTPGGHRG